MALPRHAAISLVKDAIKKSIKETADMSYLRSQRTVPVITGELRRSGNIIEILDRIQLQYTKEYAEWVERGRRPGVVHVRAYTTKNGVYVQAHSYFTRGQKAHHFIEKALKLYFKENDSFESSITDNLARNFPNYTVIRL